MRRTHHAGYLGRRPGKDDDVRQGMGDEKGVLFVDDDIFRTGEYVHRANNFLQASEQRSRQGHRKLIIDAMIRD